MPSADPHDQIDEHGDDDGPANGVRDRIEQLEDKIEALAERAERCRKIIVFGKATIAVGGVVLAAIVLGVIPFSPVAMVSGLAAVLGGIVAVGTNGSTLDQTVAAIASADAERNALIGQIELYVVEG